jgi:hypothetical protein
MSSRINPIAKRMLILKLSREKNIKTLVETGTYLGLSTKFFAKQFLKVISVELNPDLYNFNVKYLKSFDNLNLFLGDSSNILEDIINSDISESTFYLDAHASGGITSMGENPSPIKRELEILSNFSYLEKSIVIIDDARAFDGTNSYPHLNYLTEWALVNNLSKPYIALDMFVILPK